MIFIWLMQLHSSQTSSIKFDSAEFSMLLNGSVDIM